MEHQDKKRQRKLKRIIKRDGNKKRRQQLKHGLRDHPEDAHMDDFDFGHDSSEVLNDLDRKYKDDVD